MAQSAPPIALMLVPQDGSSRRRFAPRRSPSSTPVRACRCRPRASLNIVRSEPGLLRDPGQHAWADFFGVVEGEDEIWPAFPCHGPVRSALPLDRPADPPEGSQNAGRLRRRPFAHAAVNSTSSSGTVSPCSILSARTRSAKASACATASLRLRP